MPRRHPSGVVHRACHAPSALTCVVRPRSGEFFSGFQSYTTHAYGREGVRDRHFLPPPRRKRKKKDPLEFRVLFCGVWSCSHDPTLVLLVTTYDSLSQEPTYVVKATSWPLTAHARASRRLAAATARRGATAMPDTLSLKKPKRFSAIINLQIVVVRLRQPHAFVVANGHRVSFRPTKRRSNQTVQSKAWDEEVEDRPFTQVHKKQRKQARRQKTDLNSIDSIVMEVENNMGVSTVGNNSSAAVNAPVREAIVTSIKILTTTADDFRKLNSFLINNNVPFHTFALEEERKVKAVIKGVPIEIRQTRSRLTSNIKDAQSSRCTECTAVTVPR
ncbi:hypothetical protein EVAR_98684_1 [Eumeta japonica]|uniref:Nucleic-acid-binding protein from transposon X-element n=1 Tax=Eumeta variegata TaxID=151549 RepID=A0A4C1XZ92_EUMVA|nr:hypothetical protein EVAR_98684_1 [Eumeta japonica]